MQHLRRPRAGALLTGLWLAALPFVAAAAEEHAEAEGIAALGFNLPGLVAQFVNFLVLLVLLRLFLWGPIMRLLDERKQKIQEGLQRSQEAATAAAASEQEARRITEEARAEGREAVARAQETAQRLREELEQQARAQADQIVARARDDIQRERDQAVQQLRSEFASLTILAAERVIGQSLDQQAHQRLIDEVIVESRFGGAGGAN